MPNISQLYERLKYKVECQGYRQFNYIEESAKTTKVVREIYESDHEQGKIISGIICALMIYSLERDGASLLKKIPFDGNTLPGGSGLIFKTQQIPPPLQHIIFSLIDEIISDQS